MTEQGASDDAEVRKDGKKIILVCSPSGLQERYAFKPSQFKGALRRLAIFAEKHFVPEDACKWYCASWGRSHALFKDELDVSLSLSEYIELHGETRKVVRGCEMWYVCVGLKFTKKRCEMQWPR